MQTFSSANGAAGVAGKERFLLVYNRSPGTTRASSGGPQTKVVELLHLFAGFY
jgi:hypothetical protein